MLFHYLTYNQSLITMQKAALLFIAFIILASCNNKKSPTTTQTTTKPTTETTVAPNPTTTSGNNSNSKTFTENDLRYHQKPVVLTKHARCRMGCRHIDAAEIQEMLNNGTINARKSGQSKDESTCPTKAIEGKTHDNQTVRIVVAECDTKAKIVTVIDLKNDFKCTCE